MNSWMNVFGVVFSIGRCLVLTRSKVIEPYSSVLAYLFVARNRPFGKLQQLRPPCPTGRGETGQMEEAGRPGDAIVGANVNQKSYVKTYAKTYVAGG